MPYMRIKLNRFSPFIFSRLAALVLAAAIGQSLFAQEKREGMKLFEQNKSAEAIAFLEADIASGNPLPEEYNYLGLAYYQIGNYEKSVEAFKKGPSAAGSDKKLLYFNMGNSYFALQKWQEALDSYSMSSVASPSYASAVLNKANVEIKLDKLKEAVADYKRFLLLRPEDEQRPKIEKIIALIEGELAARAERERLAAEEAERIKREEERLAQKRAEEEAARRKMLEDIAGSLREGGETTNMSADAEESIGYEYDSDID